MNALDVIFAQNWVEQFREDYPVAGRNMNVEGVMRYLRRVDPSTAMMDLSWVECRNTWLAQRRYNKFRDSSLIR